MYAALAGLSFAGAGRSRTTSLPGGARAPLLRARGSIEHPDSRSTQWARCTQPPGSLGRRRIAHPAHGWGRAPADGGADADADGDEEDEGDDVGLEEAEVHLGDISLSLM
jgi:hypothetical protein